MPAIDRRKFLQFSTRATLAAVTVPQLVDGAGYSRSRRITLNKNAVIVFQGDSITDAGRDRNPPKYNNANADRSLAYNDFNVMGSGYVMMAATRLLFVHPQHHFKMFNRGVSGDKVFQLAQRWQSDCLDLQPSVLSVLVGVNDYWHTLTHNYKGTAETYKRDLKALLAQSRDNIPNVQLVIGEPFALKGVQAVTDEWYPSFDEYRVMAREIAKEFDAIFIPYQEIFDKALKHAPALYWTFDGVHPSAPGCMLMANAWLDIVKIKK